MVVPSWWVDDSGISRVRFFLLCGSFCCKRCYSPEHGRCEPQKMIDPVSDNNLTEVKAFLEKYR